VQPPQDDRKLPHDHLSRGRSYSTSQGRGLLPRVGLIRADVTWTRRPLNLGSPQETIYHERSWSAGAFSVLTSVSYFLLAALENAERENVCHEMSRASLSPDPEQLLNIVFPRQVKWQEIFPADEIEPGS
jgi:hypothetical protein